ncbi:class I SAM-dependent methyltransferase [Shewanella baltica]|uniref:class I SAM-dependent methyltransferase n=1 Tax=Shewanella baltica TaxID=62322 RepID=UPI003D7A738A
MTYFEQIEHCRLCRAELPGNALITLFPFPKAAQHFLTSKQLDNESPIELAVFQCNKCDLVQLKAAPVSYFREVITAAVLSPHSRATRLNEITTFVKKYNLLGKTALEIGCGKGGMLDVIVDAGLRAEGIEYSESSVEEGVLFERSMICGYLPDQKITKKAEVFFSFNYLEHQPDIKQFIDSIYTNSTDNAVGYITVPNLSYLLESKCLYEFVADHLVYFTVSTLRRAFEFNGFDVLECQEINNSNDILAIVRKRSSLRLDSYMEEVNSLSAELNTLVEKYVSVGKKVAVWGAGHRTLALLAISKLNNIEFIIDSAPFKQGLFSPVMLTKIVSPETLEYSDVDAVIVMVPGIYPQEVLTIVKNFKRKFNTYLLEGNKIVAY